MGSLLNLAKIRWFKTFIDRLKLGALTTARLCDYGETGVSKTNQR